MQRGTQVQGFCCETQIHVSPTPGSLGPSGGGGPLWLSP